MFVCKLTDTLTCVLTGYGSFWAWELTGLGAYGLGSKSVSFVVLASELESC